ncbi:MAG: MFS transporter [Simkaniaceae bacterium]|nr:MFS transporter [Simkaniaceae bacterium]
MKSKKWTGKYHPLRWIIWLLAITFLFYEYFIRVTPSVIIPELMQAFDIKAAQVGLLSSFYLYAYAVMQIPVGTLSDKYGARRLLTLASMLCAAGGLLFGMADHLGIASIGRFLMGIGSAFGFIGLIYVSTHWFPQKRWALLIGIGNSIGMLGAVFGEGPLSFAVRIWSWRPVVLILAGAGVLIGILIFLIVRNDPKEVRHEEKKQHIPFWKGVWIVCKNSKTWVISCASGLYYSCLLAFGALWGVPFFEVAYGFSTEKAGFATSMIYLGFVIGGPFVGMISDRLKHRKVMLVILTLLTCIGMIPVIYFPHLPTYAVFLLLLITGIFASGQLLSYIFAIESNPVELKATSVGFVNAMVFVVGSIMQPIIGAFLEIRWSGLLKDGLPVYSIADYQFAFSWFPLLLLLAFILPFFIKEEKHLLSLKDEVKQDLKDL